MRYSIKSLVLYRSPGMSKTAMRLFKLSQWAIRATITSGSVMPGMAIMLTVLFSRKDWIPVRLPGPASVPIKVAGVTRFIVPSKPSSRLKIPPGLPCPNTSSTGLPICSVWPTVTFTSSLPASLEPM